METVKISVICPTIRPKGLDIVYKSLSEQTFQDFEFLVDVSFPSRGHDLNASYNRLIKRAKGELLVSWQDYIKSTPLGLENFWKAYQEHPKTFFTAPVGQTLNWKDIEWDWRKYRFGEVNFMECEFDFGAFPKKAIYEIGGFDEAMDGHWTFDNVNVCFRAGLKGYKFLNIDNQAIAYKHNAVMEHPFQGTQNPDLHNERIALFESGFGINYL